MEGTKKQLFEYYGNKSLDLSFSDCARIAHEFINSELNGNIELLKDFSFYKYWNGSIDCDSMDIVKIFYVLLWGEEKSNNQIMIKNLRYSNIGNYGQKFGGETMNSFNTLFGKPSIYIDKNKELKCNLDLYRTKEFIEKESPLYKQIVEFREKVYTLGNFMVLPKERLKPKGCTLNQQKMNSCKDYFDKFLLSYENYLSENSDLSKLFKKNEEYLISLDYFKKVFFLDSYFDRHGKVKLLFDEGVSDSIYQNKQIYIEFVKKYISTVTSIIDDRITHMIPCIKESIQEGLNA